MNAAEQFATLNTPEWLTAFRVKCNDIETAIAALGADIDVPRFGFVVDGVPCEVRPVNERESLALIGRTDKGEWMYQIQAPAGWFQPPAVVTP